MASTPPTQKCPCSPPCASISSCPRAEALTSDLSELKLSEGSTTTTSGSPKTAKIIHNFPDQYTATTASIPHNQNPTSSSAAPTDPGVNLSETEKKQKYLIDTYTEVFDMLERKYRGLESVLKWEAKNAFEEGVVMAVMAGIRDSMEMNEITMENQRRALWALEFKSSEVEAGEGGLQMQGDGEADDDDDEGGKARAEVLKEKSEGEQEWERV